MGFFSRSDKSGNGMFSKREKWGSFYENSGSARSRKDAIKQRANEAREQKIAKRNAEKRAARTRAEKRKAEDRRRQRNNRREY